MLMMMTMMLVDEDCPLLFDDDADDGDDEDDDAEADDDADAGDTDASPDDDAGVDDGYDLSAVFRV